MGFSGGHLHQMRTLPGIKDLMVVPVQHMRHLECFRIAEVVAVPTMKGSAFKMPGLWCDLGLDLMETHVAVGQHQWYHFGVGAPPVLVYVSGDWDVH